MFSLTVNLALLGAFLYESPATALRATALLALLVAGVHLITRPRPAIA